MSEQKHTPGPWQVMNEYDGATIVIANVDGETFPDGTATFSYDFVCDTLPDDGDGSRSREIAIANARLIAAAPDMMVEIKAAAGYLRNAKIDLETGCPKATAIRTIEGGLKRLEAAIAEVEGRS